MLVSDFLDTVVASSPSCPLVTFDRADLHRWGTLMEAPHGVGSVARVLAVAPGELWLTVPGGLRSTTTGATAGPAVGIAELSGRSSDVWASSSGG